MRKEVNGSNKRMRKKVMTRSSEALEEQLANLYPATGRKSEPSSFSNITAPVLFDEMEAGMYIGGSNHPLSRKTLQSRRLKGLPPKFIKVGRLVRYLQTDLDAFLEAQRRSSTSQRAAGE